MVWSTVASAPSVLTQASESVRKALHQKEEALSDMDAALDRVRETNETLKVSEEHLRLVFDTAVDGIVELDSNDVVVRTNEAFCQMVHLDRPAVVRHLGKVLANVVLESDDALAGEQQHRGRRELLGRGGEAEDRRRLDRHLVL